MVDPNLLHERAWHPLCRILSGDQSVACAFMASGRWTALRGHAVGYVKRLATPFLPFSEDRGDCAALNGEPSGSDPPHRSLAASLHTTKDPFSRMTLSVDPFKPRFLCFHVFGIPKT